MKYTLLLILTFLMVTPVLASRLKPTQAELDAQNWDYRNGPKSGQGWDSCDAANYSSDEMKCRVKAACKDKDCVSVERVCKVATTGKDMDCTEVESRKVCKNGSTDDCQVKTVIRMY
jgi:hypothetical protein